jgi:HPt (histidine-containing phosphotransfer) domain-containing protein
MDDAHHQDLAVHPAFDHASLCERLMDDQDLARELVDAFLEDTPTQVEALLTAFAEGDLVKTERVAHRIKGAAGNLSACRLQQLTNTIELIAREGSRDEVARLVALVAPEFLRAKDAMLATYPS